MPDDGAELVLPFVVVESVGGPFDDLAYTAGWEMGALDARLAAAKHHGLGCPTVTIRRENVEQAELLAMRHGMLTNELRPDGEESWADQWAIIELSWGSGL